MEYNFEVIKDEDFNLDCITTYPYSAIHNVHEIHEKVFNKLFTEMNVFGYENIGYVMGMCKEYNIKSFTDFFERVYTNESLNNSKKNLRGKTKKEIYDIVCSMKEYAKKHGIGDIPLHIFYIYFMDVAFNRTAGGYFHECSFDKDAENSGKYKVIKTKSAYEDSYKGIDSILISTYDESKSHIAQLKPFTFAMGNGNPKLNQTRKSFLKKCKQSSYPLYFYFYKNESYIINPKADETYPNICCFKPEDLYDENGYIKDVYGINKEKTTNKIPF